MPLLYITGEDIQEGDKIRYDGLSGEVEVVADPAFPKGETDWYVDEFVGGLLVAEPTVFGRVFVRLEDIPADVCRQWKPRVSDRRGQGHGRPVRASFRAPRPHYRSA
jgi:hypothetical protein